MGEESIDGIPVDEGKIEAWAVEAERGDPVEELRKRGRRTVGSGPGSVVPVRMDAELLHAIAERAAREHVTRSEIIRNAVRAFVA